MPGNHEISERKRSLKVGLILRDSISTVYTSVCYQYAEKS